MRRTNVHCRAVACLNVLSRKQKGSIASLNTVKKFWQLLLPHQKHAAILLLCFMFTGMLLETLGVGMVVPALAIMTQDDPASQLPVLQPVITFLGNPTRRELVVAGMLFLVAIYTIKAFFLAFLAWKQSRFVFGLQADLSKRLFKGYLSQPYTFHLQRNSAQLIRNATTEVSLFSTVSQSMLVLLSEMLVLTGLSTLLIVVEPFGAAIVLVVLALAGWIFYRMTRSYILKWGKVRQYHEGQRIQHLQQGLGGAKDVKLLGREKEFLDQYDLHTAKSTHVGQRQSALQQFPRLWLELLAIIGLAVLVLVLIYQGKPLDSLLPTLGLFAAAAFRLMPSVNRVLIALQGMRFAVPVINTLHDEVCDFERRSSLEKVSDCFVPRLSKTLEMDSVTFRYPGVEQDAIREVSIEIGSGETVGFIGGSGAGKSTLVDLFLGLLSPVTGVVKVDGIDIQGNLRAWQDQIGYVPQNIFLTDDTLKRNVAFGLPDDQINDEAVDKAIRAAQLDQFVDSLPEGLNTVVGERGVRLSGGQRQRIGIARALYHDPGVLVLDEATSSLDTETEEGVMEAICALHGRKTILIVAHRLSTVAHCDRIYRIEDGCIVAEGHAEAMLTTATNNGYGTH